MHCVSAGRKETVKRWPVSRAVTLCVFVLGLRKQSYLHFAAIMCTPFFHRSDNILTAVSVQHSDLTIPYWHEPWPHNSHKTSGFLFLLTLLESAIESKAAVDTATHNWGSVSCGTASRASKCLSMIRKGRQSEGREARTGKSGEGNTWWNWGVCRDAGVKHH